MISYTINFTSDSKTPFVIPPGQYDGPNHLLESPPQTTKAHTSLNLPGAGALRYGEMINEDLVHILENFYNADPPPLPTYGQTWVGTNNHINLYSSNNTWLRLPVVNPPSNIVMDGDIQVINDRVYMYVNGGYVDIASGGGGQTTNPCDVTEQDDWGFSATAAPDSIEDWGETNDPAEVTDDWGGICIGLKEDWGYTDETLVDTDDWGAVTDNDIAPDYTISWGSTAWVQTGCCYG